MEEEERWAEVVGFPGYSVSNQGKVMNATTNKLLKPRNNSYGYAQVGLRRDGKTHDLYVHHLVAKAFITGYRWGTSIKHVEENSDNSVMNLRFTGGKRMGTLRKAPKKAIHRRIRIVETNEVFLSVGSCARYIGGDVSSIYRVLKGRRKSHKGFTFEFLYEEK